MKPQVRRAILRFDNRRSARVVALSLLVMIKLTAIPSHASAQTRVEGQPSALSVQVDNAPLNEILDALGRDFNVKYRAAPPGGRNLSGVYSGTLPQVLARVLDGYDYIIEAFDDGIRVTFVGLSNQPTIMLSSSAAAATTRPSPPLGSPGVPTPVAR